MVGCLFMLQIFHVIPCKKPPYLPIVFKYVDSAVSASGCGSVYIRLQNRLQKTAHKSIVGKRNYILTGIFFQKT